MNASTLAAVSGLALVLSAGSALGVSQPATSPPAHPAQREAVSPSLVFAKSSSLSGLGVANPNGEVIATVSDLIVNRGSGRVEYALLTSGAILGLGGKTIAVPYDALSFDSAHTRFSVNLTREQIEHTATFTPENWPSLEHSTWTEDLEAWWTASFGGEPTGDAMSAEDQAIAAALDASGSRKTVVGTVTRVVRDDTAGGERIYLEVQPSTGGTERVLLGPSWYVMSQRTAPMRGDQIRAQTLAIGDGDDRRNIALSATIRGENVLFRDEEGRARWLVSPESSESTSGGSVGRLMLVSSLVGASAHARDQDGGEIQNVIIERGSGQIAFIGFDPNENVLGLADSIILVPWQLVSVNSEHEARIDANRDMLIASQKVPDDLATLTQIPSLASAYSAFGVEQPAFRPRVRAMPSQSSTLSPWDATGAITRAFRDGPSETITGRITAVHKQAVIAGSPDATVLTISTDSGEKHVVVGPAWYVDRQALRFDSGATITARGNTAVFNGVQYLGARTVSIDGRDVELWANDRPAWNTN